VFLDEIKWIPEIASIDDLFALRQQPSFIEFRSHLANWTAALISGDAREEAKIRKNIQKINSALRRVTACSRAGRFFTYVGIPMFILDMLVAPVFGLPATVAGFALQGYSDWLKKQHSWVMIGK
jgi:hypothetical protein